MPPPIDDPSAVLHLAKGETNRMGRPAFKFLAYHGIRTKIPPIRSSDYGLILSSPFYYYLGRRLGLFPALKWSKAISRGDWFHAIAAMDTLKGGTAELQPNFEGLLAIRLAELSQLCDSLGIIADSKDEFIFREQKTALEAFAFYRAAASISASSQHGTFRNFLRNPDFLVLGREVDIKVKPSKGKSPLKKFATPFHGRLDLLLYHMPSRRLWIPDYKTTSHDLLDRLSSCPIEFQTQHYLFMVKEALAQGMIHKTFSLPEDVTIGGMIHFGIRVPQLQFGREDRPYREYKHELKSGPRKGEVELRREYFGEPSLDLYTKRIHQKMTGTGRYADEYPDRQANPWVNISFTTLSDGEFAPEDLDEYIQRVEMVSRYARARPYPSRFPKPTTVLTHGGKPHAFAPFVVNDVEKWPSIIKEDNFMVLHRDEMDPTDLEITYG